MVPNRDNSVPPFMKLPKAVIDLLTALPQMTTLVLPVAVQKCLTLSAIDEFDADVARVLLSVQSLFVSLTTRVMQLFACCAMVVLPEPTQKHVMAPFDDVSFDARLMWAPRLPNRRVVLLLPLNRMLKSPTYLMCLSVLGLSDDRLASMMSLSPRSPLPILGARPTTAPLTVSA